MILVSFNWLVAQILSRPAEEEEKGRAFPNNIKNPKDTKLMSTLPQSSRALKGGIACSSYARWSVKFISSSFAAIFCPFESEQSMVHLDIPGANN
ncbi:hypothetical protein SADUNF_Sadunf08G0084800 [Salix dunnii]|uniref:Uncharacterized protein n=1 Tax=Salix dunnii TaxID=1413687 RepID=A0A835JZT4_9ROSI|nr:hypothetical protein SADUNF_Sadunf08G0084800 [Salix dunnii]